MSRILAKTYDGAGFVDEHGIEHRSFYCDLVQAPAGSEEEPEPIVAPVPAPSPEPEAPARAKDLLPQLRVTPRQLVAAALAVAGFTRREAADILSMSPHTYDKLLSSFRRRYAAVGRPLSSRVAIARELEQEVPAVVRGVQVIRPAVQQQA
ncbi:helix-turn-helix domain-containing protein [Schumannella soli]|uniref:Uncharacterized protein n=1 Tax=Schumannella soli TaxID=2590779 RepID=A0A506Y7P8_9MICO|nr:helix-turn-helix domain-containing protein [Schumannella soli]TPW78055.1 hypothetical protein FJ657_05360 [Schumannella soli]